jgi:hypothetical protein
MTKQQALNQFVSELTKEEKGKSNARVGDVRQLVKIMDKYLSGTLYKLIELRQKSKAGEI